jgi:hypothetical protein
MEARRRRHESGEGNLGCIIWILVLAIGVFLAFKLIPVKIKSAEFYDFMDEIAKFSSANATQEQIEKRLMDKARDLEIPLEKRNLRIVLSRDRIRIDATYTIPVEFPGYTYNWTFHQVLDRPIFII